jgi:surface polysaccharide O-acyltransferase-like enzyme
MTATLTVAQWAGRKRAQLRDTSLDRARGLAMLLMLVDHVLEVTRHGLSVRESVTRASMPLFFLIGGHLVRRLSWRLLLVAGWGVALPLFVPWIDTPNVLVWYAIGAVILVAANGRRAVLVGLPLLALTMFANGYGVETLNTYEPWALWALMCCGALLPRSAFAWARRLPAVVGRLGRYPLTFYVGHLLALEAIREAVLT